jgi:hypothetical protein
LSFIEVEKLTLSHAIIKFSYLDNFHQTLRERERERERGLMVYLVHFSFQSGNVDEDNTHWCYQLFLRISLNLPSPHQG